MAITIKSHRRGTSVVKAYTRTAKSSAPSSVYQRSSMLKMKLHPQVHRQGRKGIAKRLNFVTNLYNSSRQMLVKMGGLRRM